MSNNQYQRWDHGVALTAATVLAVLVAALLALACCAVDQALRAFNP